METTHKINRKSNLVKTLSIVIAIFIFSYSSAQIPSLDISNKNGEKALEIANMQVDIQVYGNMATTTFDLTFYNPNNRVLEGDLSIPMNEQQNICRYALDINGNLREGVVVEKVKARQTFEAVVRQNIDPGIVNITKGNVFKTRIYPIPAKGNKRVVIAISETLGSELGHLKYTLPLTGIPTLGEFKLNVKVIKDQTEKANISTRYGNLSFDNQQDAYLLNFERINFSPQNNLSFSIPQFTASNYQIYTQEFNGETYFYLNAKAPELSQTTKNSPQKITIYWDNSFSGQKRNLNKEINVLENYLTSMQQVNVQLIIFNFKATEAKYFVVNKNADDLISYLQNLKYDGATSLNKLKLDSNCDEILMFSDGINTIGTDEIESINIPVYTFSSLIGSNYSWLKRLSQKTNGEFLNLNQLSVEQALKVLKKDEEKFLSCLFNPNQIEELYPNKPTRVNGFIEVVGKINSESAILRLNYGTKGKTTQNQNFEIYKNNTAPVARIWASKKIEALQNFGQEYEQEIFSLSQQFTIVTPNTALLVLDRIEDYVRHKIIPPKELQEEYYIRLAQMPKPVQVDMDKIIQANVNRLRALQTWYEKPPQGNKAGKSIESVEIIEISEEESNDQNLNMSMPVVREEQILNEIVVEDDLEVVEDVVVIGYGTARPSAANIQRQDAGMDYKRKSGNTTPKSSIKVLAWLPDAPYMKTITEASPEQIESLYFALKKENLQRPSFYVHVSDYLFKLNKKEDAIRILTNVVELDLENPELLKVTARRLLNEGEYQIAIDIYKEIKYLHPEEPQSYRDLAIAYQANKQYQEALNLYLHILDTSWNRFEAIKSVVLNELNALIAIHKNELDLSKVNKDYIKSMPLDIRISIDWSSNDNDIDLWVIDPNGEKCFYSHSNTLIGGKISSDFTRGYGPEEFSLKTAKRGTYTVYINYFSNSRQTISGPVTVYANLCTHHGTTKQKNQHITFQLENNKQTQQIGQLEFE